MEDDKQNEYDDPHSGQQPAEDNPAAADEGNTFSYEGQSSENRQGEYRPDEYQRSGYPQKDCRPQEQNNMALAALIMGIMGIVTSLCCFGGLIFGCLGIIFVQLSKTADTMNGYAKAGLIISILSLFIATAAFPLLHGMLYLSWLTGGGF